MGKQIVLGGFASDLFLQRKNSFLRSILGAEAPGRPRMGLRFPSTTFCTALGQPPKGCPRLPDNRSMTDSGNPVSGGRSIISSGFTPFVIRDRQISNTFTAGSHFDNITEQLIYFLVCFNNIGPTFSQSESRCLLARVGVLDQDERPRHSQTGARYQKGCSTG